MDHRHFLQCKSEHTGSDSDATSESATKRCGECINQWNERQG
jgi:hypothetical protein